LPPTFGIQPGFFYPSLTWSLGAINWQNPVTALLPGHKPARGQNISLAGLPETLHLRNDIAIALVCNFMHKDDLTQILTWFDDWGGHGKPSALVFDRLNTCSGQLEYDRYNTFFTKAICTNDKMEPKRLTSARGILWVYTLTFWQEHDE